jgi:PadR family transcriptional regulator PadR
MPRNRAPSPQTMNVLRALAGDPARWRYGYELGAQTGLKAGSLYPILIRLADRELLEARWEESPPPGRPARHLYRLTLGGQQLAAAQAAATPPVPAAAARAARAQRGIAQPGGA